MTNQKQKKKLKVSFNLGFRETLGVIICAIMFFVAPVALVEYTQQLNNSQVTETYTQTAIESAQGQGRVAGVSTSSLTQSKYFVIPFINFKFDTTLSETSSIIFLFGVLLFIGGTVLGLSQLASSNKKIFYASH